MRSFVIVALGALAACSNAGTGAAEEAKYQMVKRDTEGKYQPYRARCQQAKAVAAAYLADRNEAKYKEWQSTADLDCGLTDVKYL